MYKEFETPLQEILKNNGLKNDDQASKWSMSGKASIDDKGTIVTNTMLMKTQSAPDFTGGMYAQFMDKDGKILFITPLLKYSYRRNEKFPILEVLLNMHESVFRVDPNTNIYTQTTQIAIQLFHVDRNQLGNDFTTVAPAIINNTVLLSNGVPGRKDVKQTGTTSAYTLYSDVNMNDKTKIIATWNHFKSPSALSPQSPVTVYTESGFDPENKGKSQSFDVCQYDFSGNNSPVGNDKVRSIKVKRGYRVTLYEDVNGKGNFGGSTCVITSDSSSLPEFDGTTGIVVEHPAKEEVIAFMDDNYRNPKLNGLFPVGLSIGYHRDTDNDAQILPKISSFRIPYGYQVSLWDKTGCTGNCSKLLKSEDTIVQGDVPSLGNSYEFNDKTKSLLVEFLK